MIFPMLPLMYLNIPRMGSPFCIATLLFISKTAPAPSLTWLELPKPQKPDDEKDEPNEEFDRRIIFVQGYNTIPAVVVPSFLNTGLSLAKSDNVALGRIPSSTEIVTGFSSLVFGSTIYYNKVH